MPLTHEQLFYYWTQIAEGLLLKTYLPGIINVMESASDDSWLLKTLEKRSDMVRGTRAYLLFRPRRGWGWRPVHPGRGTFPSGGKTTLGEQSYRLAMYGAGIQLTLEELANLDTDNPEALIPLMDEKIAPVYDGFPSFLQVMLRSPQSGIVCVANAAESNLGVSVDNDGLWNSVTGERLKYLEEGMYIQWYRNVAEKVGEPVEIVYVDHDNNTVYLAESRGVADNDFAVLTTIDGMEDMYWRDTADANDQPASPGLYDVLDDDNSFQGVDRSLAVNAWARAEVKDMSGAVLSKTTFRKWLRDLGNPETVVTAPEVLDWLYEQLFRANERYVDQDRFRYGYDSIKFDRTRVLATPDSLRNSIDRVDPKNVMIAQKGEITDPHGRGWYALPKQPVRVRDFAWWGRLIARNVRRSGRYHNFAINTTIGS